jgi:hypothetical protein
MPAYYNSAQTTAGGGTQYVSSQIAKKGNATFTKIPLPQ